MNNSPKIALLNNIDDLDLEFYEGENELSFEIEDYSFVVTYSLEEDEYSMDMDEDSMMSMGNKLNILSINAYDNLYNTDVNVYVDDDIQKLFSDYYYRTC